MKKRKYISGEKIFQVIDILFLVMLCIVIILPVFSMVMTSFLTDAEIARRGGFIFIPEKFDFSAYLMLWKSRSNIMRAYGNTLFVVIVGTALNLAVTIGLAYGLSRPYLKGKTAITVFIFITMLFGGGLVPSFLLVKSLGLMNSLWALILPGMVGSWNMFVMRNFFKSIPSSLEEAATIDGANNFQILTQVVLPLSKASIATIGLFYAVGHWNSWFGAMIYINDASKLPMQNILRNIMASANGISDLASEGLESLSAAPPTRAIQSACVIVTMLPILFVYPFIQKYFVKGVMVGSVKG